MLRDTRRGLTTVQAGLLESVSPDEPRSICDTARTMLEKGGGDRKRDTPIIEPGDIPVSLRRQFERKILDPVTPPQNQNGGQNGGQNR